MGHQEEALTLLARASALGFYLAELDGEWVVLDEYLMEEWTDYEEE